MRMRSALSFLNRTRSASAAVVCTLSLAAAFAVAKGDPDFLAFLNAWITAREADTWLDTRRAHWFESVRWRQRVAN